MYSSKVDNVIDRDKNVGLQSITGLKGVLCILILLHHCSDGIWILIADYGYIVVDIFVCLSGYLMAYNYSNKICNMSFIQYFKRRYLKVMPLYWITDAVMYLWVLIIFIKNGELIFEKNFTHIIFEFSGFYYGFYPKAVLPANYPAWTICALLLCYIWYYIVERLCVDSESKYVIALFSTFFVGMSLSDYFSYTNVEPALFNRDIFRCIAAFSVGVFLHWICKRTKETILRNISRLGNTIVIVVVVLLLIYKSPNIIESGTLFLPASVFLAPMLILNSLYINPIKKMLSYKLFFKLGQMSVSIYLWHAIVCAVFCSDSFGIVNTYYFIIIVTLVTLIIAYISNRYIEPKINMIIKKYIDS